ncbi:hypothetical protein [Cerasicoccus maritimus]|uniref:hypothetical protein n=1 Tax=Cerasicoccus maritimus TaxID=490089 RepID=UPI002852CC74|nr:hypothetical protein [Cerasicoccus maritimus]
MKSLITISLLLLGLFPSHTCLGQIGTKIYFIPADQAKQSAVSVDAFSLDPELVIERMITLCDAQVIQKTSFGIEKINDLSKPYAMSFPLNDFGDHDLELPDWLEAILTLEITISNFKIIDDETISFDYYVMWNKLNDLSKRNIDLSEFTGRKETLIRKYGMPGQVFLTPGSFGGSMLKDGDGNIFAAIYHFNKQGMKK